MNNTTNIIAVTLLTLASSASFAGTDFRASPFGYSMGDNHVESFDYVREGLGDAINKVRNNNVVIQFNVQSTNISPYSAMYLVLDELMADPGANFCDSESSPDELVLVTYFPYSPHKEIHNGVEWPNGWRSVHTVVRLPDYFYQKSMSLLICSRDKDGGVDGDLDDFRIEKIVIHYKTEDEVDPNLVYRIGDPGPAGGVVFEITDGGRHGLEAAPVDQSVDAEWGCIGTEISGANGTAVGTGAQNTTDILVGCTDSGIAAEIAANYELNGLNDWFLPSKDELDLIYSNLHLNGLGGFANVRYWSSTEFDRGDAWFQNFLDGGLGGDDKADSLRVRAVRAF